MISAVEQRANQSLDRVQELQTASQNVEQEAKQLQTDLQPTLQLAQDALDLSKAALQSIQNEDSVNFIFSFTFIIILLLYLRR